MDEGNYKKITYKNSLLIRQKLIGLKYTLLGFYFILMEDSLTISSVFKTITSG